MKILWMMTWVTFNCNSGTNEAMLSPLIEEESLREQLRQQLECRKCISHIFSLVSVGLLLGGGYILLENYFNAQNQYQKDEDAGVQPLVNYAYTYGVIDMLISIFCQFVIILSKDMKATSCKLVKILAFLHNITICILIIICFFFTLTTSTSINDFMSGISLGVTDPKRFDTVTQQYETVGLYCGAMILNIISCFFI
jgi:hypothetical protein